MLFISVPPRLGNAHANIVPYQVFAVADGHIVVAVGNDRQFARLCDVIGLPALACLLSGPAELLFLTGLFENLPDAVLGAIVIAATIGLINISEMRRYWRWHTSRWPWEAGRR